MEGIPPAEVIRFVETKPSRCCRPSASARAAKMMQRRNCIPLTPKWLQCFLRLSHPENPNSPPLFREVSKRVSKVGSCTARIAHRGGSAGATGDEGWSTQIPPEDHTLHPLLVPCTVVPRHPCTGSTIKGFRVRQLPARVRQLPPRVRQLSARVRQLPGSCRQPAVNDIVHGEKFSY